MKKQVLFVVALLAVACNAFAQPQTGYIGLYTDETREHWCVTGVGFYPVEMWIWCLPSVRGQICAEFSICYPANVIQSMVTQNPAIISVTLGDLPSGMSVCYVDCQWAWHWNFHQSLWVTDQTKTSVQICPHPGPGVYQFANCEPGYPTEPCIIFANIFINYETTEPECECPCSAEKASWGAIKSMLNE